MEIKDALWLKELEKVWPDNDAKRGQNAKSVGELTLELSCLLKVTLRTGMEDDLGTLLKDFESGVGKGAVTEKDDFWQARVGL